MPAVLGSLAELDAVFCFLLQVQPGGSVQWRNRGSVQLAGNSPSLQGLDGHSYAFHWHQSPGGPPGPCRTGAYFRSYRLSVIDSVRQEQEKMFPWALSSLSVGNISSRAVRAKAIHQTCCHLPCSPVFTWGFGKPSLLAGRPWAFSVKACMCVMSCSEERWFRSAWWGWLCLSQLSLCEEPAECMWRVHRGLGMQ